MQTRARVSADLKIIIQNGIISAEIRLAKKRLYTLANARQ